MRKLLLLLFLLSACTPENPEQINGYIEGEYVYASAYSGGILDKVDVQKGQLVTVGSPLFSVDGEIWSANLLQAQKELEKAQARYADLSKGKRQQELDVILQQKAQAKAVLENAEKEYKRARELIKTKNISSSEYDRKRADFQNAAARVDEAEASLAAAMLPAREDELKAARKDIEIAEQNLIKVKRQADNNAVVSKVNGQVEDVYFRPGEYVQPGNPVVSVLPPENVKIRFFVSEELFPEIRLNMPLVIMCDGCRDGLAATVSFISTKSEFTPPVIYSLESRKKLVFMIEAVFDDKMQNLHPGLPVTVRMAEND